MKSTTNNHIIPFRVSIREDERQEVIRSINDILVSGRLVLGDYTKQFEMDFSSYVGAKYGIATNSGSSALEIIFRSLNLRGKRILIPTNTNFATAMAAINAGAKPILYDAGIYPNVEQILRYVEKGINAVVIVHIGGYITPDAPQIAELCLRNNIPLIEDAAHAHGSKLNNSLAGTFGVAAAFSFFPTKTMSTGEGGMIVTSQEEIRDFAYCCRDQGKGNDNRLHVIEGNSWRISEFGAALGTVLLKSLDDDIDYRTKLIDRYRIQFADSKLATFMCPLEAQRLSGHKIFCILDKSIDRDGITSALHEKGIELARGAYDVPLHNQPVFSDLLGGPYSQAEEFCSHHIALPLWRDMPYMDVDVVTENILGLLDSMV